MITGIEGFVNLAGAAAKRIGAWSIDKSVSANPMVASNTKGAAIQIPGNIDWSGRYSAFGSEPEIKPRELFQFRGVIEPDADDGVYSGATGTICNGVTITWDQSTGAPIRHEVEFGGNGELTEGTVAAAVEDTSAPEAETSSACIVTIATNLAAPSYAELEHVTGVRLTLSGNTVGPQHTSTSGIHPTRARGNLTGEVAIDLKLDELGPIAELLNAYTFVRLYTSETLYWDIQSIMFQNVSGFNVDRENPDYLGVTLTGAFSAFADIDGTMTEGTIIAPSTAIWWPE